MHAGLQRFLPSVVVVVACAWVARIAAIAFGNGLAGRGALLGDMHPLLAAHVHGLAQSIAARDADLWMHGANLGYPAGTFAPLLPSAFAAAVHALGVDVHTSIHVALFVPLVLLPASSYVGLRVSGASGVSGGSGWSGVSAVSAVSSWHAAIAAVAVALALGGRTGIGIDSAFAAGLLDETWAALFLPLAAGLGARFIVTGATPAAAVAASIACALCHPIVGASCAVAWLVACVASERRSRIFALLLLVVVGTAPMTLPAVATWSAHGVFGPHLDDGDGGFAPARFIAFIVGALDGERAPVLTCAALVGLLASAVHAVRAAQPSAARTSGVPFLAIAFACCAVLLCGPFLAWGTVPWGRFVPLLQLALCALVGIGVLDVVTAVHAAIPLRSPARADGRLRPLAVLVRVALTLSIVALVVIAADGQSKRMRALRFLDDERELAQDLAALATIARDAPPAARVAAVGSLRTLSRHALSEDGWPGLWSVIGPSVSSSPNAALVSRNDVVDTVQITNTGLIVVAHDAPQSVRPAGRALRAGRFHVYDTRQRSWFVPVLLEAHAADDGADGFHEAARAWWRAGGYRTGRHLVDEHVPAPAGRGKVTVLDEEVSASRFAAHLDVATDAPRAVLLKVSWHPWWRATLDGKPVRVLRVSPALLAAEVPPGPHLLAFTFERPPWTWLLWLLPFVAVLVARRFTRRA